jgi:Pyruvate/2-oxoacid:ferredoxin oxidoreductase delta subunit
MDGIVAMEGNGPRNGDPRPMSVLLLSADPVALDATVCRLVDLDPALVPPVVWGERWGLGSARDVRTVGDPLASFVQPGFRVDRGGGSTTGIMSRFAPLARRWITPRPVVVPERCTRCGTCVKVCPVEPKAVDFRQGRDQPPGHDYAQCIRCYCCQEICPERAIVVQRPPLNRLVFGRRERRA